MHSLRHSVFRILLLLIGSLVILGTILVGTSYKTTITTIKGWPVIVSYNNVLLDTDVAIGRSYGIVVLIDPDYIHNSLILEHELQHSLDFYHHPIKMGYDRQYQELSEIKAFAVILNRMCTQKISTSLINDYRSYVIDLLLDSTGYNVSLYDHSQISLLLPKCSINNQE